MNPMMQCRSGQRTCTIRGLPFGDIFQLLALLALLAAPVHLQPPSEVALIEKPSVVRIRGQRVTIQELGDDAYPLGRLRNCGERILDRVIAVAHGLMMAVMARARDCPLF